MKMALYPTTKLSPHVFYDKIARVSVKSMFVLIGYRGKYAICVPYPADTETAWRVRFLIDKYLLTYTSSFESIGNRDYRIVMLDNDLYHVKVMGYIDRNVKYIVKIDSIQLIDRPIKHIDNIIIETIKGIRIPKDWKNNIINDAVEYGFSVIMVRVRKI